MKTPLASLAQQLSNASTSILVLIIAGIFPIVSSISDDVATETGRRSPIEPFLLLISNNQVSVAQLPMIDHGLITSVYEITGQRKDETSRLRRSVRSTSSLRELPRPADERIKQQMPDVARLRKFTRRHSGPHEITSSAPPSDSRSSLASPSNRNNQEAVHEPSRFARKPAVGSFGSTVDSQPTGEATKEANGRDPTERLPRASTRSNSLNQLSSITITDNNGQGRAMSVPESGSAAGQPENVTSALFRGRRGLSEHSKPSAASKSVTPEEGTSVVVEGNDDGAVRFEDFDVHMRLGYVFVADSVGRVHRFRLNGFQGYQENKPMNDAFIDNLIDTSTPKNERTGIMSFEPTAQLSAGSGINVSSSRSHDASLEIARTSIVNNHDTDEYVLNEVSPVSHDRPGQHPTISGGERPSRGAASTSGSSSGHTSPSLSASTSNQRSDQTVLKPKIIWSRTKHGFSSVAMHHRPNKDRESLLPATPQVDAGLTTSTGTHLSLEKYGTVADGSTTNNQRPSPATRKSSRLQIESENESESEQIDSADEQEELGSGSTINHQTQLAVDWVNNIIFVLDKYRLLMVDFDGNNELVLIDDFDQYTRPVDIKVDPLNDFLFWIQAGTFQNSIYRLDLDLVTAKLFVNSVNVSKPGNPPQSEPQAITSRHNAHAVIFDLPRTTRLFTLDHKHSKIYVPVFSNSNENPNDVANKTSKGEAEVFSVSPEVVTHMNSTTNLQSPPESISETTTECSTDSYRLTTTQIRAYNLDGTDQGPFRGSDDKVHLFDLDEIQDLSIDNRRELIYLLTNGGKDLLEELNENGDKNSTHQTAQHILDGKQYSKLIHFDSRANQPKSSTTRSSIKKLIYLASNANSNYRRPRLTDKFEGVGKLEVNPKEFSSESFSSLVSRNAPYVFIGIVSALVLSIYLIYSFVFHQSVHHPNNNGSIRDGSSTSGSSIDGSQRCDEHVSSNRVPRWNLTRPSHDTDSSTLNRNLRENELPYDVESTNYGESNAVDEHYRDVLDNQGLFNIDTSSLANLRGWPNNLLDMSNKLYVPVEVIQDEVLASINRVCIDQLEIEKKSPLGEGHFGTVLQGTITCSRNDRCLSHHPLEKNYPDTSTLAGSLAAIQLRRVLAPSSSSSGHGSSSVSSEFVTANSVLTMGDYLTPKSNPQSGMSDYSTEEQPPSSSSYAKSTMDSTVVEVCDNNTNTMKFKVAIKKLKDNASHEEKRDFLQEAKLLANFNHPNIVHLIGICLDRGSTLLVMELMLGGDLIRYMQENNPKNNNCAMSLTEEDMLMICLDIVNGCCYLEELNYIHRDLAARNCLVSSRRKEERVVKLADFGLARDIYKDSYYKKLNDSAMPLKWMAPECFIEQKFTIMSDVWSFGVVMWEVMSFCQEKPYASIEPFFMKEHLTSGARLRKPTGCSDEIYKLMSECWQLDPQARPSFQECRATLIEIKSNR